LAPFSAAPRQASRGQARPDAAQQATCTFPELSMRQICRASLALCACHEPPPPWLGALGRRRPSVVNAELRGLIARPREAKSTRRDYRAAATATPSITNGWRRLAARFEADIACPICSSSCDRRRDVTKPCAAVVHSLLPEPIADADSTRDGAAHPGGAPGLPPRL
jgi:hypothetical protein